MAGRNRRDVVPDSNGGWTVRAPGAKRASARTQTQAAAQERAREILRNSGGGELQTHGRNGRIRAKDTIPQGNDPRSIKG